MLFRCPMCRHALKDRFSKRSLTPSNQDDCIHLRALLRALPGPNSSMIPFYQFLHRLPLTSIRYFASLHSKGLGAFLFEYVRMFDVRKDRLQKTREIRENECRVMATKWKPKQRVDPIQIFDKKATNPTPISRDHTKTSQPPSTLPPTSRTTPSLPPSPLPPPPSLSPASPTTLFSAFSFLRSLQLENETSLHATLADTHSYTLRHRYEMPTLLCFFLHWRLKQQPGWHPADRVSEMYNTLAAHRDQGNRNKTAGDTNETTGDTDEKKDTNHKNSLPVSLFSLPSPFSLRLYLRKGPGSRYATVSPCGFWVCSTSWYLRASRPPPPFPEFDRFMSAAVVTGEGGDAGTESGKDRVGRSSKTGKEVRLVDEDYSSTVRSALPGIVLEKLPQTLSCLLMKEKGPQNIFATQELLQKKEFHTNTSRQIHVQRSGTDLEKSLNLCDFLAPPPAVPLRILVQSLRWAETSELRKSGYTNLLPFLIDHPERYTLRFSEQDRQVTQTADDTKKELESTQSSVAKTVIAETSLSHSHNSFFSDEKESGKCLSKRSSENPSSHSYLLCVVQSTPLLSYRRTLLRMLARGQHWTPIRSFVPLFWVPLIAVEKALPSHVSMLYHRCDGINGLLHVGSGVLLGEIRSAWRKRALILIRKLEMSPTNGNERAEKEGESVKHKDIKEINGKRLHSDERVKEPLGDSSRRLSKVEEDSQFADYLLTPKLLNSISYLLPPNGFITIGALRYQLRQKGMKFDGDRTSAKNSVSIRKYSEQTKPISDPQSSVYKSDASCFSPAHSAWPLDLILAFRPDLFECCPAQGVRKRHALVEKNNIKSRENTKNAELAFFRPPVGERITATLSHVNPCIRVAFSKTLKRQEYKAIALRHGAHYSENDIVEKVYSLLPSNSAQDGINSSFSRASNSSAKADSRFFHESSDLNEAVPLAVISSRLQGLAPGMLEQVLFRHDSLREFLKRFPTKFAWKKVPSLTPGVDIYGVQRYRKLPSSPSTSIESVPNPYFCEEKMYQAVYQTFPRHYVGNLSGGTPSNAVTSENNSPEDKASPSLHDAFVMQNGLSRSHSPSKEAKNGSISCHESRKGLPLPQLMERLPELAREALHGYYGGAQRYFSNRPRDYRIVETHPSQASLRSESQTQKLGKIRPSAMFVCVVYLRNVNRGLQESAVLPSRHKTRIKTNDDVHVEPKEAGNRGKHNVLMDKASKRRNEAAVNVNLLESRPVKPKACDKNHFENRDHGSSETKTGVSETNGSSKKLTASPPLFHISDILKGSMSEDNTSRVLSELLFPSSVEQFAEQYVMLHKMSPNLQRNTCPRKDMLRTNSCENDKLPDTRLENATKSDFIEEVKTENVVHRKEEMNVSTTPHNPSSVEVDDTSSNSSVENLNINPKKKVSSPVLSSPSANSGSGVAHNSAPELYETDFSLSKATKSISGLPVQSALARNSQHLAATLSPYLNDTWRCEYDRYVRHTLRGVLKPKGEEDIDLDDELAEEGGDLL